jgi:ligand-binding sensor domain-containing protein
MLRPASQRRLAASNRPSHEYATPPACGILQPALACAARPDAAAPSTFSSPRPLSCHAGWRSAAFVPTFYYSGRLGSNWVTKMHKDSRGYLWICTVEGISLFDGYRFTNFSTREGLPSRLVADMFETQTGDFWFATESGLARLHRDPRKTSPFEAIHVGNSKNSNNVQALYQDVDGTIWCGTAAGLYRFRPQDGETLHTSCLSMG